MSFFLGYCNLVVWVCETLGLIPNTATADNNNNNYYYAKM